MVQAEAINTPISFSTEADLLGIWGGFGPAAYKRPQTHTAMWQACRNRTPLKCPARQRAAFKSRGIC